LISALDIAHTFTGEFKCLVSSGQICEGEFVMVSDNASEH